MADAVLVSLVPSLPVAAFGAAGGASSGFVLPDVAACRRSAVHAGGRCVRHPSGRSGLSCLRCGRRSMGSAMTGRGDTSRHDTEHMCEACEVNGTGYWATIEVLEKAQHRRDPPAIQAEIVALCESRRPCAGGSLCRLAQLTKSFTPSSSAAVASTGFASASRSPEPIVSRCQHTSPTAEGMVMAAERKRQGATARNGILAGDRCESVRTAIGYVRVSTDMQASEGVSLEAQQGAIRQYCELHGCGCSRPSGCSVRWQVAEAGTRGRAESHTTRCGRARRREVRQTQPLDSSLLRDHETYFRDGAKELVAIREAIRLDSALGRALISILLVFAQMEREAVGERTREAIQHIRRSGYHFGKVPYGKRVIRAPDNPRMRLLVDDDAEQAIIAQFTTWAEAGIGVSEMASRLNAAGIKPRQDSAGPHTIYNLRLRLSQIQSRAVNVRSHTDEDVKDRMLELRARGHTHAQVASILNELGFLPMKGRRFTERSVQAVRTLSPDEGAVASPISGSDARPHAPRARNGGT